MLLRSSVRAAARLCCAAFLLLRSAGAWAQAAPAQAPPGAPPPIPAPLLTLATLPDGAPAVEPNDNRRPAGRLAGGVLRLALEARAGVWHPDGPAGPALAVAAFGELGTGPGAGAAFTTPGPLVRVPAGTEVRAAVRNALPVPITVYGLGDGPDGPTIAPGATHAFRFHADAPGLRYYAARFAPGAGRRAPPPPAARFHDDAQLHAAVVVDPPTERGRGRASAPPPDRVFVISNWFTRDLTTRSGLGPHATLALNGRSWPFTERVTLAEGDSARWRVVNASMLSHPMHLHGAYFRVDARGDAVRDTVYAPAARRLAVTELLLPGQTMALAWTPVHAGNWLFHCHLASHMAPRAAFEADRRLPAAPTVTHAAVEHRAGHGAHAAAGPEGALRHMEGLVLGVTVTPRGPQPMTGGAARALRLVARSRANVYGEYAGYAYVLGGSPAERAPDSLPVPGPVLELLRGERVAVTLVNHMHEAMAVHWHGIELESFADGVPGWSGAGAPGGPTLPMIAPGDSLTVRFTPPRAGTFMYHSHANEMQQISSGLYGAIVVTEPGAPRDPAVDHLVVVSDGGPLVDFFGPSPPVFVNGSAHPAPLVLAAGRTHRLRLVNVRTEALTTLALRAAGDSVPATWRVVAKDGAALPPAQAREAPATLRFAPGEIYDVEVTPRAGRPLALHWAGLPAEARTAGALELRVR